MREVLDRVENKGFEKGRNTTLNLVRYLISNNRMEDLEKASNDTAYCDKLVEEIFPKED